jgi:hypothetical protein
MNESYALQINEIKKIDYGFFEKIAFTGDPLTYTFSDAMDGEGVQVEIEVRLHEKIKALLVTMDFTSDIGKWIHVSDVAITYLLKKDNSWQESSYDGSESLR